MTIKLIVEKLPIEFLPNPRRVILRFLKYPSVTHQQNIINRLLRMQESNVESTLESVFLKYASRHKSFDTLLFEHYERVEKYINNPADLSWNRKLLVGACFSLEYSIESAAFFNPSIVPHPRQKGAEDSKHRIIISFRATGEGHVSSIEFREGVIDESGDIIMKSGSRFVGIADRSGLLYEKKPFIDKLHEMKVLEQISDITEQLPDTFDENFLGDLVADYRKRPNLTMVQTRALDTLIWYARSNFNLTFDSRYSLSERVIFPVSTHDSAGIEDARFVMFTEESGEIKYYATYTAYNGYSILPQMIETSDFVSFTISTLHGDASQNKGMALFPRKINGRYAMISRNDNENLFIVYSDDIHVWREPHLIFSPQYPWEAVQIGNCGSPIETDCGWLLLTHGVGPIREYSIGAILLDRDDPSKVIAHLPEPLLQPDQSEREGYVPNVVYSCGALAYRDHLIIPYAVADTSSKIAKTSLSGVLKQMVSI